MLAKQSCQHCGTHIEFDAVEIGNDGYTILCPKCQAPVTLLRPPPIAAPPTITAQKRRRLWILGISVIVFGILILLLVSVLNVGPTYAIMPEPCHSQKPLSKPLDSFAFDLALKELNKLFYKSGDFVFANAYRGAGDNRYIQGKRGVYTFGSTTGSEADRMNGREYYGDAKFFIVGPIREYNPDKMKGWSAWTMSPGDTETENFLYGTTLWLTINKKKGGDWEWTQPPPYLHPTFKLLSREKVEELLKLP